MLKKDNQGDYEACKSNVRDLMFKHYNKVMMRSNGQPNYPDYLLPFKPEDIDRAVVLKKANERPDSRMGPIQSVDREQKSEYKKRLKKELKDNLKETIVHSLSSRPTTG